MKRLSYWGYCNPVKSQLIIVVCQLMLGWLTFYMGIWLFSRDIVIPAYVIYTGAVISFAVFILYPIRRARYAFWKPTYYKQKLMDFLLVFSFVIMSIGFSNREAHAVWAEPVQNYQVRQIALKYNDAGEIDRGDNAGKWSAKNIKKELRRSFKEYLSAFKEKAKAKGEGGRIALVIILMVLGMLLAAVLACGIACSSGSGLVIILLIMLGIWAGILVLGIRAIRRIKGRRKNQYEPMPSD